MQDDAALRADEIAAGLPQVCFLDHGCDTFEPTRWDPSGSVVFAEQPPRLCRVGSQFAVCLSLGGLVEEPDTCPRRKTILALQEDRYAHGRTQLAVGHHRDELVPQLDLVEGLDDTVAVVDPTSSGVEQQQREHGNCNCGGKTGATSKEKPRDDPP